MKVITSKDNETIKGIKKLKDKKYRDESNSYIIEGIKMVEEAINENAEIKQIIICEDCLQEELDKKLLYEIAKYDCMYVNLKVFEYITTVVNPQGIMAVIGKNNNLSEINYNEDIIIILDGIQDPGNLGTILRTADSVNLKQIVVTKETADVYNPKVVRSTMGAIFRINVIESDDILKTIKEIKKNKFKVLATSLGATESIYDVDFKKKAIVIGNEANGVSKQVLDVADNKVIIPMLGKAESLNASVATGVILYEYVRQKTRKW